MAATELDITRVRLGAAVATLPVAWLAYRFYETPLRFTPRVARSLPRTFGLAAAMTLVVLAVAVAVRPDLPSVSAPSDSLTVADLEAPPGSSLDDRVAVAVSLYRQRAATTCRGGGQKALSGATYCVGGDPNGDRSLLLIGDSHAGQWGRALGEVARRHHLRLLIREHDGCPPYPVAVTDRKKKEAKVSVCRRAQAEDLPLIDELRPDGVIIATWSGNADNIVDASGATPDAATQVQEWHDAMVSFLGVPQRSPHPGGGDPRRADAAVRPDDAA